MEIKGFVKMSFVDWDGNLSSVIFLPNCNLRCPYCYNSTLVLHPEKIESIPFESVEAYLTKKRDWIDGVCVTGGEPTLHKGLPDLCSKLKEMEFRIKIDTNGTNPEMVEELMDKRIIDYVALDIKAPLAVQKYSKATSVKADKLLGKVKQTIRLFLGSRMNYEFRTTVVPTIHEEEDIKKICDDVKGCKKFVLQKFDISLGKTTLDPNFSKLKPFTDEEMKKFLAIAQKFLPNAMLR